VPAIVPWPLRQSITLDSDWATDFGAKRCLPEVARHVGWRRIYKQHLRRGPAAALGRTFGAQDLDTIWRGFIDDTSLIGDNLVQFLDRQRPAPTVPRVHGQPGSGKSNRIELHPTV